MVLKDLISGISRTYGNAVFPFCNFKDRVLELNILQLFICIINLTKKEKYRSLKQKKIMGNLRTFPL